MEIDQEIKEEVVFEKKFYMETVFELRIRESCEKLLRF